jgi:hypothetical protein
MNRKQFLKLFGWVAASVALAPSALLRACQQAPIPDQVPPKKLKMLWSVELEQDLLNFHGIDSQELSNIMSRELSREIDQEMISKLNTDHYVINSRST